MKDRYPLFLANRPHAPNFDLEVRDKFTGDVVARVAQADAALIDRALEKARAAVQPMRDMPAHKRQAVLEHLVRRVSERREELAALLCAEAGKPIKDSRGEVTRLIDTLRLSAEEATRQYGEVMPLDISPRTTGYAGMWKRVPIGVCSFISPFNFPLNLVAHKIGPALAVGCPFVLKPASLTPLGALMLGELLAETDLPEGSFSILPCPRDGADLFTTDPRIQLLSFTGSPDVGWALKAKAGKKKVVLELGGNAAVVVDADADLADAVKRILTGAFYQSGQSCISVQRIIVHESVYAAFRERLVAETRTLKCGDPRAEDTFIGPIISAKEADRIEQWIGSAVARGARLLCGGGRSGNVMEATLLENVPPDEKLYAEEVFGPVAVLESVPDYETALARVNDSRYGLQAGIFTRDIQKAWRAWDVLDVGGVLINEVPSWRVDHMPYGGVKDSGLGREGVRFAMEDMTELRMFVLRRG
ncbi:MAG TPA: aldehyde dehydrogenase family protein [Kiritimatiellia bacterium]|nr:aldehyde dehydrogenase family protein [Kiritimatiellia bacterium]